MRAVIVGTLLLLAGFSGCSSSRSGTRAENRILRAAEHGSAAIAHRSPEEAIPHYRRAVKEAWAVDDSEEIARNAYNLAASLAAAQRYAAAQDWLLESRAAFQKSGQDDAAVLLLESRIAREQGAPTEADRLLDRLCWQLDEASRWDVSIVFRPVGHWVKSLAAGIERLLPEPDPFAANLLHAQAHLEKARLALDEGDPRRAADELEQAETLLAKQRRRYGRAARAELMHVRGRLRMQSGEYLAAAESFRKEADQLRSLGRYRTMGLAWESAGEAWEAAGFFDRAAACYLRAAHSRYGRDQFTPALQLIQRALPVVEQSGDRALRRRYALLFGEISSIVAEREEELVWKRPSMSSPDGPGPTPEGKFRPSPALPVVPAPSGPQKPE